jgi:electron transfer flavoprotein beta subunit
VDNAIQLVCDDTTAWDSWATAFALAQALRQLPFQLILCGGVSADRNAGLVGPYVAEILGIPHVPRIAKIEEWHERAIVVHRRIERGDREIVECALPALLTVEKGINRPRLPAFQAISRARTQALDKIALNDLDTPEARLGRSMNRVEAIHLSGPKPRRGATAQVEATQEAAARRSLMMKGGAPKPSGSSRLIEGVTDQALDELERLLKEHGIDIDAMHDGPARDTGRQRGRLA